MMLFSVIDGTTTPQVEFGDLILKDKFPEGKVKLQRLAEGIAQR